MSSKSSCDINGTHDGENVVEFKTLDSSIQELIKAATEARKNAYCPYSKFQVGSALLTKSNEVILGCNVESVSYTPSICAERNAISHAICKGHREFKAIAVVAYQEHAFTSPCGVCRQVLAEFGSNDFPVYMAKPAAERVLVSTVHKLLPYAFVPLENPVDNLNRNT